MIILDTNIVSELTRKIPSPQVLAWFDAQPSQPLVITSITVAELRFGVNSLPEGKRRQALDVAVTEMLEQQFTGNVLPFDHNAAEVYGVLAASLRNKGIAIGHNDMMIAAIALHHEATLVTRNKRHFVPCRVTVVNPFDR